MKKQESTAYVNGNGGVLWKNKEWKKHRLDGPAVEFADGSKIWYVNGKRHRLDGAACEWSDGTKEWYIDGIWYYSEEDWKRKVKQIKNGEET